ncbi:hypothetical protein WOLCODRAFT_123981, partial [Wolfiporia cocos MD-104 SS10]
MRTEAFETARRENKPIFLSVGYSACHWCHVLVHKSFEDEVMAKLMNDYFINIKVDREERPDVDKLYMTFLQATNGGGGWVMSVWLTLELNPIFAGTYFPPGRFRQVLVQIAATWEEEPERIKVSGQHITEQLRPITDISSAPADNLNFYALSKKVYDRLAMRYDPVHGGFGGAPKFPQVSQTTGFLVRYATVAEDAEAGGGGDCAAALTMVEHMLVQIYRGGIHDHVGGGVARYSVDERWHVPHFEKMLYDQAQLLSAAVELKPSAHRSPAAHRTLLALARSIIAYVSARLTAPAGGFYSAEDVDSLPHPGVEKTRDGAYYTWMVADVRRVLGADAELFAYAYGVKEDGNCNPQHDVQGELKGQNVLYIGHELQVVAEKFVCTVAEAEERLGFCLQKLRDDREASRPRPHLDDKILAGWNGSMISGLARAVEVLESAEAARALQLAERAAAFLRYNLYDEANGELRRSWREGPGPTGQADDCAFLIQGICLHPGLLDLHEASGKEEYVLWAVRLQETLDEQFFDAQGGGYFASAPDGHVIIRLKDAQDGAEPSAASVTLSNLHRLAHYAEDRHAEYTDKARSVLSSNAQLLETVPHALGAIVSAAIVARKRYRQFILTESPTVSSASPLLSAIRARVIPNRVLIRVDPANPPRGLAKLNATLCSLVDGVEVEKTQPSVRVCQNFACGLPIEDVQELAAALD